MISGADVFFFILFKVLVWALQTETVKEGDKRKSEIVLIHFLKPLPHLLLTDSLPISIQSASILQCPRLQENHNVLFDIQSTPCNVSEPASQTTGDL